MNKTLVLSELRVSRDRKSLTVRFNTGENYQFPAELLRALSPSAEVRGHSPSQRKIIGGKKHVEILSMEPVGNYAVRILFDDTHSTGIYTWGYFDDMGRQLDEKWQSYLSDLDTHDLSRDEPGTASPQSSQNIA